MSTSYLETPFLFKLRKVTRYVSLYGTSRTLAKIKSQYHMVREAAFEDAHWRNPRCRTPDHPERFVGVIGCGAFAYSCIAYYLRRRSKHFLAGAYDRVHSRSLSLCRDFGGKYATKDVAQIIADPGIRLVYIASNHASHAEYAIACIEAGKNVHIEKPHVISSDQLERLLEAHRTRPGVSVFLGFNRPKSPHFKLVKASLDAQPGAAMINWFIAGHEINDEHWYFAPAEGGRVLGNLCHWTDLTLELVGIDRAFPCEIVPASHLGAASDFCVGIRFADGSVAAITFSAKGHTFEGVREILNAHRGDALVSLVDFHATTVEIVDKKLRLKTRRRDHGHGPNIANSFDATIRGDPAASVSAQHYNATARLFLGVKEALDRQLVCRVTL